MACDGIHDKEMLYNSGVLVEHCDGAVLPPADLWQEKSGGALVNKNWTLDFSNPVQ